MAIQFELESFFSQVDESLLDQQFEEWYDPESYNSDELNVFDERDVDVGKNEEDILWLMNKIQYLRMQK